MTRKLEAVAVFARHATAAVDELVHSLPADVQELAAQAVAGGAHLAIGMVHGTVFLDLIDVAGKAHRICAIDPQAPSVN